MKNLEGVMTALATPFFKGEIDWASLKKLVRWQLDGGVDGLVISGTTGESPTLTAAEKKQIFAFVKSEVSDAVTLVMGTGSNSTAETLASTKAAKEWGAQAALVVVPYYNKPSQRGLIEHFTLVAREGGLPIVLYNVPSRTVARLELLTIQELAKVSGIVAIKEATGDIEFGQSISQTTKLLLSSGDDGTYLNLASKAGARGVISVISHLIPKQTKELLRRAMAGEDSAALEFEKNFGKLNSDLYREANPIPVKYALFKMGIIASPELRLPLTTLDSVHHPALNASLKNAGLL